jgi:DNA invertase Pin-like site-specific DNA recombinase
VNRNGIRMEKAATYYRVSTKKQGKSKLGLQAQQNAVNALPDFEIIREFFEVESGKKKRRPILKKALRYCKKTNAVLIIANIDRLSRNALVVASILGSKVKFIAADKPNARPLDHLEDAIKAEREGEAISRRTKDALREAKKRGVILGKNGKSLAVQNKEASLLFAQTVRPIIEGLKDEGYVTLQSITNELNRRKVAAYRPGSKWHKSTVYKILGKRQ